MDSAPVPAPPPPPRTWPPPAEWSVAQALDCYLAENGFTKEAYDAAWTPASFFGLPIAVPNTRRHRWAILRHDLHHVVTGYGTDLAGEGEVAAWEVAGGLPNVGLYTQGIVRTLLFCGLLRYPRRTLAARRLSRGRNLFQASIAYEAALALSVGELRELLGIPRHGLAGPRALSPAAPRG